ncbi:aspartyl-tRNA(Asn)/glutamyl-tRNA(Gln) amidotransferase subunit A [Microvirga flocculans]|uniref:Indoleacetamide hydrolase n=1 Tax=Microvirga flocculans TaxID=217168 RepID=A0A7W6IGW0_9HYPH|nr:amidase [Microvirga flocculans]MBB4041247.1 aspartyl-tRNA(Asn)/glutamyl-tRNA(Gln) amidotransferase subunit A [Microvirga flocculans]
MTTIRDKLETILARLERRAAEERVFLRLYEDAARAAADAADARKRAGVSLGPLDGAIVSIKDLFDVAGETTLAGSVALRDRPPAARDAAIVRRLRQAGAVILGKTNMVEFAYSGIGLNPHYGTPGNAADPLRVPGGSSSGAGVSVAEGTSEISIGSDTGGSVRIPAAFNGVVGFKPTARRIPLEGVFPLSPSLDSVGPLAKSVQDCADADAIMAGEEPRPVQPCPLAGLRIGLPRGRLFSDTEPMVAQAFEATVSRLSQAGARLSEHDIDDLLEAMAQTTRAASIASIEAAEIHADWLTAKEAEIDPLVGPSIARSGAVPAPVYIRMLRDRRALAAAMDERLSAIDVLALPTTAISAPPIAPLEADEKLYHRTDWHILRNTMFGNQFDLTAISLPIPGCERPVGFMLVARHGQDRRLLDIAAGVEAMLAQGR